MAGSTWEALSLLHQGILSVKFQLHTSDLSATSTGGLRVLPKTIANVEKQQAACSIVKDRHKANNDNAKRGSQLLRDSRHR